MTETNRIECKRELTDDLEITSAESLPEGLTRDEFFAGVSIPRNKEIMRIFKDLEMVEQLGSGIPRILKAYSKNNFTFMEHFIRMNFPATEPVYIDDESQKSSVKTSGKSSVKSSQKILRFIKDNPNITTNELASLIGVSRRAIAKQIAKLKEEGALKRVGPDKGGHWEIIEK